MMKSKDVAVNPLTAAQIEKGENLPPRLHQIGKEVEAKLAKADKYHGKAEDMIASVGQLLAEAKELCDGDGFNVFKAKYCPSLGKSRAYEIFAIATNKTTVEEVRAEGRKRQAKSRANKKQAMANSVTVTEKSEPAQEPQGAHTEASNDEGACTEPEQTPEPAKPLSAVKSKDEALFKFTDIVSELVRRTIKRKAKHFAGTGVPADDLATLGNLLLDVANLKKADAFKPTPTTRSKGNGTVSPEQSGDERKAHYAARDAADN